MRHIFPTPALHHRIKWVALLITSLLSLAAMPQETSVITGKDGWLFTRYEFATPADVPDTQATLNLLVKTNQLLAQKNIALALVIVPSKIRINPDQLPDPMVLDPYTAGKYAAAADALQAAGVHVVRLDTAFLSSPHRTSDTPLFLHLDTHWSPRGSLLAAETIQRSLDDSPRLKAVLATIPEEKFTLDWADHKISVRTRDLVKLLPPNARKYAAEQVLHFKVSRVSASTATLLSGADTTLITAIGSSYSDKITGYPDALRYALQRNVLDISIPVDQGPWVGMLNYLQDEAFKTSPPALIIWEIPERELRSPPNYKFRDGRYILDNNAWLAQVTQLLAAHPNAR